MKTYEEIVKFHRKKESGAVLENLSNAHAKILFENLLEVAAEKGEKVYIYSGTLNKEFYEQLTKTIKSTMEKSDVFVAVAKPREKNQVANNAFAEAVKSGGGELKEGAESFMGEDFPHFILVGNNRYRFEKDDTTKEAIACFNDPRLGGLLVQAGEKLMAGATPHSK